MTFKLMIQKKGLVKRTEVITNFIRLTNPVFFQSAIQSILR